MHPGGIKTRITKSGRIDSNIRYLGFDERYFFEKMERAFITDADKAARSIIRAVEKNKRRVLVGPDAYVYDGLVRLLPSAYQPIAVRFMKRLMK